MPISPDEVVVASAGNVIVVRDRKRRAIAPWWVVYRLTSSGRVELGRWRRAWKAYRAANIEPEDHRARRKP